MIIECFEVKQMVSLKAVLRRKKKRPKMMVEITC